MNSIVMDFQNRAGGKTGSGSVASWSETNCDRRERLRQLALETIDLNKVSSYEPAVSNKSACCAEPELVLCLLIFFDDIFWVFMRI